MEIWIGRDGERHGPYKEDDVREWLRSGKVSPADLAWYEGLADWQPLSVLFRDEVPAAASPAPGNPYAAPSAPLQALPQTTAAALEDLAGFWKRLAAYIIDAIILYVPNLLIMKAMGGDAAQETLKQAVLAAPGDPHTMLAAYQQFYSTMGSAMLITAVLAWLYFALLESSSWQATLGKLALGIRVTDLEGRRISFPHALGRYLAKFLSWLTLCIGFMMAGWTRRKQALHDKLAKTLVLNGRASEFKANPSKPGTGNSFSA
ncbi:MAG: RDD family protein [Rhodanobacter sp.]